MFILNFEEWLIESVNYFPLDEFLRRIKLLGWKEGSRQGSHITYYAPKTAIPATGRGTGGGMGMITFSTNNYEKNALFMQRNIFHQYPDVKNFFSDPVFRIPKNFNIDTQRFEEEAPKPTSKNIKVSVLFKQIQQSGENPEEYLAGKKINGKTVEMGSFQSGKLELINVDGSSSEFEFHQDINMAL